MGDLQDRRILLGITGSIAAFKAAVIASELMKAGAQVRVVMTGSAKRFVTPETLAGLTGHPPATSLWLSRREQGDGHIELAHWPELAVVAPASAHFIAKAALGLADDLLSAILLATPARVVFVPAMETRMWMHPATQQHVVTLRDRGGIIIGPASGRLASGASGLGRMVEPADVVREVGDVLVASPCVRDFNGVRICVSAGPTQEPLDPVRFISNRSSGKMGYAIATAAAKRGATVTLVSGPVDQALVGSLPDGIHVISVSTAAQMHDAMLTATRQARVVIMAAAVADYRPTHGS